MREDELLVLQYNGKTLLENMLDRGEDPSCLKYEKRESIKIIFTKKRYDLVCNCSITNLLKLNTINERFIETLLKAFKKGDKTINICLFDPFDKTKNIEQIAIFYLMYAKYDLIDYLPELTKKRLFEKIRGKSLLSILIKKNKNLTINKILSNGIKKDFDVAMFLRCHNIIQSEVNMNISDDDFVKKRIVKSNEIYDSIVLTQIEEDALKRLYNAFYLDSNKDAVNTLINSFKVQFKNKNPYALKEIEILINIKNDNINFRFEMGREASYFVSKNLVTLDNCIISGINHEIGHVLFHKATSRKVEDKFFDIVERIKSNPISIDKVSDFSKSYHTVTKKVNGLVNGEYENEYSNINNNDISSIQKFLNEEKKKKIELYMKNGYSRETLEVLFRNVFSVKDFLKQHKKVRKKQLSSALLELQCAPVMGIGDIIDAIYGGEFLAGKLIDSNNEVIKPCTGHGIFYYNVDKRYIFDEMIANYSLIIKSDNSEMYLRMLRYYVGNELVDYLKEYYESEILGLNIVQKVR